MNSLFLERRNKQNTRTLENFHFHKGLAPYPLINDTSFTAQKNNTKAERHLPSYRYVRFKRHHPDWDSATDSLRAETASRILVAMDKEFAPL